MALVLLYGLVVRQDGGGLAAALPKFDSEQRTEATGERPELSGTDDADGQEQQDCIEN